MKKHIALSLASILAFQLNVAAQVDEKYIPDGDEVILIEEEEGNGGGGSIGGEDLDDSCASIGYIPVCGVDGYTYSNKCYSASSGVDVDYEGECKYVFEDVGSDCTDDSCVIKEEGSCGYDTPSGGGVLDWLYLLAGSGSADDNDVISESSSTNLLIGSYNMVVADYAFLELQNITDSPVLVAVTIIDKDGNQIGGTGVTIPANGRRDVDIHSLADDSFGSLRVTYTAPRGSLKATMSQYKTDESGELIPASSQVLTSSEVSMGA